MSLASDIEYEPEHYYHGEFYSTIKYQYEEIIHETKKAVLIKISNKKIWVPKSQIEHITEFFIYINSFFTLKPIKD